MTTDVGSLTAILLLGAWHGVNPGMGWLFATALGMQERRSGAVTRALLPLAAGHGVAIAAALALALVVGVVLPLELVRWGVAALLVGLGVSRLVRHRHPRYGGMRMTRRQLAVWSLLMASAHGAGLMVIPFALGGASHGDHGGHASHAGVTHVAAAGISAVPGGMAALTATLMHTAGYLLVTAALALAVYHHFGLQSLRRLWVNLDLVWGVALVATGVATVAT